MNDSIAFVPPAITWNKRDESGIVLEKLLEEILQLMPKTLKVATLLLYSGRLPVMTVVFHSYWAYMHENSNLVFHSSVEF